MDHCTGRFPSGVLAQLGACNIRIVEATGSTPVYSIRESRRYSAVFKHLPENNFFLQLVLSSTKILYTYPLPPSTLFSFRLIHFGSISLMRVSFM